MRESNIQPFPSHGEQNTSIGWMLTDDRKQTCLSFLCRFFLMYLINKDETEHTGQVGFLWFVKSRNKVMHTRQLVLFLWFETVNPSFHRASWLSQWPSNFGILQRQSEGCGITFSSGTDPIFTLSFKTPYHSQQTHDILMHQLKPLSWFYLLVNCAKSEVGGKMENVHW